MKIIFLFIVLITIDYSFQLKPNEICHLNNNNYECDHRLFKYKCLDYYCTKNVKTCESFKQQSQTARKIENIFKHYLKMSKLKSFISLIKSC
jgi:hypothetical protein